MKNEKKLEYYFAKNSLTIILLSVQFECSYAIVLTIMVFVILDIVYYIG